MSRIAVIGAGAWGTGLAIVLGRGGRHQVRLWAHEKEVRDSILARRENELCRPGVSIPATVLPTGSLQEALDGAKRIFQKHDFDVFVEIIVESPRAVLLLFGVFFDKADPADTQRALDWYTEIRTAMIEAGYPPYRETAQSSPHVFDQNPVTRKFLSSIKNALDPNGTLAPGRYGIK